MIDIIIPVLDNPNWLRLCLSSIRAWTKNPYRITIVDNGSKDPQTKALFKEVDQVLSHDNSSFSASCNLGIAATSNPYICLLNSDVIVQEGWDTAMLSDLNVDPLMGMVGARTNAAAGIQGAYNRDQHGGHLTEPSKDKALDMSWQQEPDGAALALRIPGGMTPLPAPYLIFLCVMAPRAVFDKVGNLDPAFAWGGCEDLDYSWKIVKAGYKLGISTAFVLHGCSQTFKAQINSGALDKVKADQAAWRHLEENHGKAWVKQHTRSRPRVAIGIMSRTEMCFKQFAECLTLSIVALIKQGWDVQPIWITRRFVSLAREKICEIAMDLDCDVVVFVDDDQVFLPEHIVRLVKAQKDICAALIYQRVPPFMSCVYNWSVPEDRSKAFTNVENIEHTGLRKVDAVGFGMVALSRGLIETMIEQKKKLKKQMFEFLSDGFGEDMSFCIKAGDLGFQSWVDTDCIVGHLGDPSIINEETRKAWLTQARAEGKVEGV